MKSIEDYINTIICGDCAILLRDFPPDSIDCIVADPPYGISFMGKEWDKALPKKEAFKEMFRVLKPGALAFIMASPRQDVLWRMLAILEECGFELKQSFVSWIYKTGFPKAYDVSKGIDIKFIREEFRKKHGRKPTKEELKKLVKEKRKVIGISKKIGAGFIRRGRTDEEIFSGVNVQRIPETITEPASNLAKKWQGWKSITGLKPALECILMVNKPLREKTIVNNVLKHEVGAINVNATRMPIEEGEIGTRPPRKKEKGTVFNFEDKGYSEPQGRFPANLLIQNQALSYFKYFDLDAWARCHGFLDVPKPSKRERDEGLERIKPKTKYYGNGRPRSLECFGSDKREGKEDFGKQLRKNIHPTVKPIKLMAYLIELGCPEDGIVLDPYVGSGTTCIAAQQLGRKWIGIEINPEYYKIAKARLGIKEPKIEERKEETLSDKEVFICVKDGCCNMKSEEELCLSKMFVDCEFRRKGGE